MRGPGGLAGRVEDRRPPERREAAPPDPGMTRNISAGRLDNQPGLQYNPPVSC